jgi:alpha-glucuronidase
MYKNKVFILLISIIITSTLHSEDGYELWLRYHKINDIHLSATYASKIKSVWLADGNATFNVIQKEIETAYEGLLGIKPLFEKNLPKNNCLVIGTVESLKSICSASDLARLSDLGKDGYIIFSKTMEKQSLLYIAGNTHLGALYGSFHFIRLLQMQSNIDNLDIVESPKINNRILNHWDNLDRTVERGYAGFSIWDWHKLPDYIDQRYIDYARANASIGINGTVLTNVNANSFALTKEYIEKIAALANTFRPYGIKVYLTARFSSPIEIGGLVTADPLDQEVKLWWKNKAKEIYQKIPDFGGFLVKANSEGQPGPQNYGRSHAEGANLLADALAPYGGIVLWRAFVYAHEDDEDRAKQANNEFEPLDGQFMDNVIIQVKNGPLDFQPREPFHPLFGSIPKTQIGLELQITQEYLGQGTHLVYMAPLYKECLESDTYKNGTGSTIARIIDGSLYNQQHTAIAGVSNIGTDRNWTGHHFGQANWYAFGRLAWDHSLQSDEIAKEWISLTFSNNKDVNKVISDIMLPSREICVNYMMPLGLHHIMGWDHHYGPGPWVNIGRADWTSLYYHRADSAGIGFDRTKSGSNALSQYSPEIEKQYTDKKTCPEKYLLWFHRLNWDYETKSGRTLWREIVYKYYKGADDVKVMAEKWATLKGSIDDERFEHVSAFLEIQKKESEWWRNACVLYFQTFSKQPIPEIYPKPDKTLDYYKALKFPYAPGIKPEW